MYFTLLKNSAIGLLVLILSFSENVFCQGPDYNKLYINEVSPANFQFVDEYGDMDDWIEIYNAASESINLSGLFISDDLTDPHKWQISASHNIPSEGYAIIWFDGEPEQGKLHAPFKLNQDGEQIGISQSVNGETLWIDTLTFGSVPKFASLGRKNDGDSIICLFGDITPGLTNNESGVYLAPPLIQPLGSILAGDIEASISSPDTSVLIFYTLDGTEPDTTSFIYSEKIAISNSKQITAKAFRIGGTGISSKETYIKKIESDLPIISLEIKKEDLFDSETGIYVRGTNGITGHCVDYRANWNQDWEKPCSISLFEPNDSLAFRVTTGIKIGGGCSRGYNMKSFNIYMRSKYGNDFIDYEIFPGASINEYHRIKLRNAGSDFGSMMLRDEMNQVLLFDNVDIDLMNYRPAILYINGEFWGLYAIRESFNEDYIMSHHGYSNDEIDMIKNPFSIYRTIKAGDDIALNELYNFAETNDLSIAENYAIITEQIDIEEYINYNVVEIYYANYDWPSINTVIWRPINGGKWRWMLTDTDGSTNFDLWYDTYPAYNSLEHATIPFDDNWPNSEKSTLLLRKLLENEVFKTKFISRTDSFINSFFNVERVHRLTDSIVSMINPVMDMQVAKWGENISELGWGNTMEGSRREWENNVQDYKDFFSERPFYINQFIDDYFGPSDIFNLSKDQLFSIFPNPAKDIITIKADNVLNTPVSIVIYNLLGQSEYELSFDMQSGVNEKQIDVSHIHEGLYLVVLSNTEEVYFEKLVIAE